MAPEKGRRAGPVAEDSEEERIDDTRVPRLHGDLNMRFVICAFYIKENYSAGMTLQISRRTFSCSALLISDSEPPSARSPSSSILQSHCHTYKITNQCLKISLQLAFFPHWALAVCQPSDLSLLLLLDQ